MYKLFLIPFLFAIGTTLQAQGIGVGMRVGDPSGFTVKTYKETKALEINVGRSFFWGFNNWRRRFYNYQQFDDVDFLYRSHTLHSPISVQVHYLIQRPLGKSDGMDWYFGFGGQMRLARLTYNYRERVYRNNSNEFFWEPRTDDFTEFDVGADGVIGLEYTFEEVPLSLFIDATIFIEMFNNPFAVWAQTGLGVRYNLR